MALTRETLAGIRTLDDLVGLAAALGYQPRCEELALPARHRLGLGQPEVTRAAIVGAHQQLTLYGIVVAVPGRAIMARIAESLALHGSPCLLLGLQAPGVLSAALGGRQLRVSIIEPSAVSAEILGGLAPRPGESGRELATRAAGVLREEGLTTRFFRELTRLHEQTAGAFTGMPRATGDDRRDLALIVLTRVLFLYFVQAKGWLAGRRDFLPSLLDTALRQRRHFHQVVYDPLCFGALSAPLGARTGAARALGDIPFLNGGLFERHALERRFPEASLPNEAWRQLIDELFSRFHFTLREDADADAVDPEMLGRVFEGLMRGDRRRSSGTYFTPRDLLQGVVGEALSAALQGRCGPDVLGIRLLDPAVGSGAFLLEALRQIEHRLGSPADPGEARDRRRTIVRDCLFGVDADPMAVRLAELRLWLALVVDDEAGWNSITPLPNLDRNLRQGDSLLSPMETIHGARLPQSSMLRAVAEQRAEYFAATGRRKSDLSRRLRAEERRVALAATDAELQSLDAHLADAITGRDLFGARGTRDAHRQAQVDEWRRRRRELRLVRRRIHDDDALPFFSYDVHFADVLAAGGFDVVLGNPPWVRGERLPPSTRRQLAARYSTFRAGASRGFAHIPDLSVAFVERAMELTRPGGVIALLLPAKLLRAGYAARLRAHLRRRATVLHLDDRSHAPDSGFDATVFPLACVMRNAPSAPRQRVVVKFDRGAGGVTDESCAADLPLLPDDARSPWLAVSSAVMHELRRLLASGPALHTVFRPRLGVKTGANEVFLRDWALANELPSSCRVPAVQGRDISPFVAEPSACLLAALDASGAPLREPPADVMEWIRGHRSTLLRRSDAGGAPPWALFRTELLKGRWLVVWRDIARRLEAAVLDRSSPRAPVPLNTCYGLIAPDAETASWLVAWLNSPLIRDAAALLAERASGGCFRFSGQTVGMLPVPPAGRDISPLTALGRAALEGKPCDDNELDQVARAALGIGRLAGFDDLRRNAGGDCRPAVPGAGGGGYRLAG